MEAARILFPALRWDKSTGFSHLRTHIDQALEMGVGGFILFGGDADQVHKLCARLHGESAFPLLIGSDFERGAGQQFRGATPLPPAGALGYLDDPVATRAAGSLTAREARNLGINWVYAPVADLDVTRDNPIIGTRAYGGDPLHVARHVAAFVVGCESENVLACVKHFPGHGRTTLDSHLICPTVEAPLQVLERDMLPFQSAVNAGVSSVMTAHVSYPALDPSGLPATLSRRILEDHLRGRMGFGGIVVTDALIMGGFASETTEAANAVVALNAGCDALLYPRDMAAVLRGIHQALDSGALAESHLRAAIARIDNASVRVECSDRGHWGRYEDRAWTLQVAMETLRVLRGDPVLPEGSVRLVHIDDDLGGAFPPYSRHALTQSLRAAGIQLSDSGKPVCTVFCDVRAWKGRSGLAENTRAAVASFCASHPSAPVVLFGDPKIAEELPFAQNLLCAWGGEALMQEAVAGIWTHALDPVCSASSGLLT